MSGLRLEALAAAQLLAELRSLGEDDPEVLETAVEGQTDLREALSLALHELAELEALGSAVKAQEARLAARRKRFETRRERLRGMILTALEVSDVPLPVRLPEGTVSVGKPRTSVHVYDEQALPAPFWREEVQTIRKPDIDAISVALASHEDVPGAAAGNGVPTLIVKRS